MKQRTDNREKDKDKACLFENINKIDKLLARLLKQKKKTWTDVNISTNIRKWQNIIITNPTDKGYLQKRDISIATNSKFSMKWTNLRKTQTKKIDTRRNGKSEQLYICKQNLLMIF